MHRDLEQAIARNYDAQDSIAFVSGHAAAVSTIATLLGPKDLVVHDALIHNCIVVGAQLAGCTRRIFPHNDLDALETMLAADRHRFAEALRSSPQGPQITNLRNRIQAVEQQIVEEKRQIGGSAQALAPIIADYERLVLEREFADRALASALATLESARIDAQRQQLYLERVVEPHAADYPAQPKRLLWIAICLALSFSVYTILRFLIDNVRAHQP